MDLKIKKLANGTLDKLFIPYVKQDTSVVIEVTGLTKATKYTGFWAATNQDPIFGLASDVFSEEFDTEGTTVTPTFASNISTGFFALLALLFALFILI